MLGKILKEETAAMTSSSLIERGDGVDWQALNKTPFMFRHRLTDHPLFQISQLVRLVDGIVERGDPHKWVVYGDDSLKELPPKERLSQALLRIEEGSTWLKLSSLHEIDPAYNELFQAVLAEVEEFTGLPLGRMATWKGITAFVASPKKVTPYHFDHDTNFLFQIRGTKDVYLFDPHDRSVLTEEEIEHFYLGNAMAGKYREELMAKGVLNRLTPGTAVHHPPLAPHLVFNGDNVSVSISMYFSLAEADARAKVYQANYCLRRMGLRPTPPGVNLFRDNMKVASLGAISKRLPKTQAELLYSGINRALFPVRLPARLALRAQKLARSLASQSAG